MAMSPDARRRSERSKQAILTATRELVAEVGFVRLTMEAIASRAGVGKQTIYRWWPSKGSVVFDALLDEMVEGSGPQLLAATGDVVQDFRTTLEGSVGEFTDPNRDKLLRTILAEVQHDPVLSQELIDRLLRPQFDAAIERIRAAQEAGQIDADLDPRIAMEMLFGPMLHRWLLRAAPLDRSYVDRLLDHAFRGLSSR
jgi:AcrR family transcriptional regulator